MNYRASAALAIGRRRLLESLIHPGFYLALALGLLAAYALVTGFIHSVDSSGFNYAMNPLYNLTGGVLSGAFGSSFVGKVFARGPLLFALHIAFLPVLLYLSMTSVYRFGVEKSAGAIELLCYGPSDGTAYFLASLVKDVVLTLTTLAAFLLFFIVAALIDNLAITGPFLLSFVPLFAMAFGVYVYGVLVSVLTDSANTALALFLAEFLLFFVSLLGSQAIVGGYVESLSTVGAWIIQWFSPFFYWSLGMRGQTNGDVSLFLLSFLGQIVLAGAVLVGSHFILRSRGVKA